MFLISAQGKKFSQYYLRKTMIKGCRLFRFIFPAFV